MNKLYSFVLTLARDETAQDLVEYALLAGFIAVAAGAFLPNVPGWISTISSKMSSLTQEASTTQTASTAPVQLNQDSLWVLRLSSRTRNSNPSQRPAI